MMTIELESGVRLSSNNKEVINQYLKYGAVLVTPVVETQKEEKPVEVKQEEKPIVLEVEEEEQPKKSRKVKDE